MSFIFHLLRCIVREVFTLQKSVVMKQIISLFLDAIIAALALQSAIAKARKRMRVAARGNAYEAE